MKRACAVASAGVLLASGLPQAYRYATQVWTRWQPPARETTIEHRVATWLNRQKPGGRVLVSGSLRFRLNSWYDLPQVGGVFESGLRNRMPIHLTYQIFTGEGSRPESEGADAVRQMIAMGVEYAVVHGPQSAEPYHDYSNPRKFEGVLERVFHTADDSVYRVPFRSLAHVVRENEYPEYPHQAWMHAFAAALIDPARPRLAASFHGASEIEIRGAVPPGTFVSVLVSYDPGWRAEQDGKPVSIAPDPLGFMKLAPATSPDTRIVLRFGPTAEQIVFAATSALAWLGAVGLLLRRA
ncbi:MAG: hypothetical protein HYZ57_12830 [Acidobacteria bacterium]|nr:hypothetical protein [Acidobacteriota bacterium]